MTDDDQRLWDLLREAWDLPYGAAQIALVEQIIPQADARQMDDLSFQARMLGTNAYVYGGEAAKSFVTFSWCLSEFDRNPTRYRDWQHTLLWHFKYMVTGLRRFPEVPLDRIHAVLDEMARRWADAGYGPHAVYAYRHHVAEHLGDLDAAQEWFDRWRTTPRDDLSDCIGCDPTSQVEWLRQVGRDEEAVALAEPVLAGRLTCTEQPQSMLTALLTPYLRTGRLDQARDAHRRAYLRLRPNLADLPGIADHVQFCARTGNEARALEIVERHLPWLDRAPSPYAGMVFAASAALALRRAAEAGYADATVRRPAQRERPAATPRIDELAVELTGYARELAARFDARNGTARQGQLIEDILAAEPLVDQLPLGTGPSRRPAPAPSASIPPPAAGTPAAETPAAGTPAAAVPEAGTVPESAGPDDLLDLASARHRVGDAAGAAAAWRAFDDRYAATELTVLQRARRSDGRGLEAGYRRELRAAAEAFREAAQGYAQAGDEARRQRALGRAGQAHCGLGETEVGMTMVRSSAEYLLVHGSPGMQVGALYRLAMAEGAAGRYDEALAALDQVEQRVSDGVDDGSRDPELTLAITRAGALADAGRFDAALAAAGEARRRCPPDDPATSAHVSWITATIAERMGDDEAAVAGYDEVIVTAPEPGLRDQAGLLRAGLLAGSPRAAEAVDDLVEWVARFTAQGDERAAAWTRHRLSLAYLNTGRPLDAAEIGEDAVAGLDGPAAVPAYRVLAEAYRRLDQPSRAVACLESARSGHAEVGDQAGLGECAEQIGDILDRQDEDAAAARQFAAAVDAYRAAGLPLDELRAARRHSMSVLWSSDPQSALEALAAADALAEALPADGAGRGPAALAWERAMLDYDAARMLGRLSRFDDALDRASRALAAFTRHNARPAAEQVVRLRARLMLDAGRPAEAERAAREGIASSDDPDHRRWLSGVLAAALEAQGRRDEAASVRGEADPAS